MKRLEIHWISSLFGFERAPCFRIGQATEAACLPTAGDFSHAGKVTKSASKPRFWNPFPADRRGSRRPMPTSARTQEPRAENSAHLRRGRRPRRPEQKYTHLYISHRQRQRRRSRDDSTFYAPCKFLQTCGTHYNKHPVCGARKGFLNRRFKRRFLHTFCRCWQKVCRRRLTRPPPSPLDRRRPRAVQYPLTVMPVFPSNSRNRSLLCRNFSTPTAGFPILPRV